jgi:hypothetical protein
MVEGPPDVAAPGKRNNIRLGAKDISVVDSNAAITAVEETISKEFLRGAMFAGSIYVDRDESTASL